MEITTILVIVNIVISALQPIIKMFGRTRHSECLGAKVDIDPPDQNKSCDTITNTNSTN
jgi:hypothetical protein